MTARTPRYEFGDTATGVVADENDWGSAGPRIIPPRHVVTGVVVGVYPQAPRVVKVQARDGATYCVRVQAGRRGRR